MKPGEVIQGTAIALAVDADGPLAGVLLRGESGSGKSDLALRLIESCPWRRTRLVADDAVILSEVRGQLQITCPSQIRNMLEIRGVGIVDLLAVPETRLRLVCDLGRSCRRMPEETSEKIAASSEVAVPVLSFDPLGESAADRLRLAVRALLSRQIAGTRQDTGPIIERHKS